MPSLVILLVQEVCSSSPYTAPRLRTSQSRDHLRVFGTISGMNLLLACTSRKYYWTHEMQRDAALELELDATGEGIVGFGEEDDRETVLDYDVTIEAITLHRDAQLLLPNEMSSTVDLPLDISICTNRDHPVLLDLSSLESNDTTTETLHACAWLLRSSTPGMGECCASVQCKWDMLRPLLQTVSILHRHSRSFDKPVSHSAPIQRSDILLYSDLRRCPNRGFPSGYTRYRTIFPIYSGPAQHHQSRCDIPRSDCRPDGSASTFDVGGLRQVQDDEEQTCSAWLSLV